jgi:2-(1,2-epoxy-1,2-dihydrophenyl)acetyl-CoA isomerase
MLVRDTNFQYVEFDVSQGKATVTINRPDARNSLCEEALDELLQVFVYCQEQPNLRVVNLRGQGKVFCSGGDVAFFRDLLAQDLDSRSASLKRYIGLAHEVILAMMKIPCPVVVSVRGAAAGYGMSLACMADIIVAGVGSNFIPAYSALGTTPDGGLTFSLPAAVGSKRAQEVLALNLVVGAQEAYEWGLVNYIVPDEDIDEISQEVAGQLVAGSSIASKGLKRLLNARHINELSVQLDRELESFVDCACTADFEEGVSAFIEKRVPVFGVQY